MYIEVGKIICYIVKKCDTDTEKDDKCITKKSKMSRKNNEFDTSCNSNIIYIIWGKIKFTIK